MEFLTLGALDDMGMSEAVSMPKTHAPETRWKEGQHHLFWIVFYLFDGFRIVFY